MPLQFFSCHLGTIEDLSTTLCSLGGFRIALARNYLDFKMAMNEFELTGNNRYFKYKYAQETAINVTTFTETWGMKNHVSLYKTLADYLKRCLNIKTIYEGHKVSYINASKLFNAPDFFNNANIIIIPKIRSFFDGRQEYFSPSPVYRTTKTIIVSTAPKKVTTTSLSFLNMDTSVVIFALLTLVLLSLLLVIHSIVTKKYESLPKKKVVKKMAQETLKNVWKNASLLCAEPIPFVLPDITCRLLVSSWLIGVTFILFFLGCFLRTDFTTESYNSIDTISDLIKSGIPPIVLKGSQAFDYLKYLATQDKVVKDWLDAMDLEKLFVSRMDYKDVGGYIPIISGEKSLIAVDPYLSWIMVGFLSSDSESKMFLERKGGLYFSQHDFGLDYSHLIFNTSWLRSSSQVHENLQLSLEPIFETQLFTYLHFENHYLIEQVKWKRPLKSTSDLDLSSVIVPFYFLLMLLSGTVALAITEKFIHRFA